AVEHAQRDRQRVLQPRPSSGLHGNAQPQVVATFLLEQGAGLDRRRVRQRDRAGLLDGGGFGAHQAPRSWRDVLVRYGNLAGPGRYSDRTRAAQVIRTSPFTTVTGTGVSPVV